MSLMYYCGQKCYEFINYGFFDMSNPREAIICLFHVFAGVMAAYIAYNRNKNEGPLVAITMSVLAFFFGFFYLIYWTATVILQDPKYKSSYDTSLSKVSDEMLGAYSLRQNNL